MDLQEEKKLIIKAQQDTALFGEIFDHYYPKILPYILKRTGSLQVAEDLTSEVFFKALKNLWQFRWQNVPFGAWLYKIANNEINSFFRKNKHKVSALDEVLEKNILNIEISFNPHQHSLAQEEALEEKQNLLLVHKTLLQLPLKYQEVLVLRFLESKKIEEICIILNKKKGTVKSLLVRGIELLKKETAKAQLLQPFLNSDIKEDESSITEENI